MANTLPCPGCKLTYERTEPHVLHGAGLVAYCELCHRQLTLGAKKSHVTTAVNELRKNGKNYDTVWQIALDEADWEHFQIWGKLLT